MRLAARVLREFITKTFGSLSAGIVVEELKRRGFELTKEDTWKRPQQPNSFEWNCIYYLMEELDLNGYED